MVSQTLDFRRRQLIPLDWRAKTLGINRAFFHRCSFAWSERMAPRMAFEVPAGALLRDTSGVGFQAGDRSHSRVSTEFGLTIEYPS